jgi:hypothetical protein
VIPQPIDEVVDRDVGVRAHQDRVRDLPVLLEELDRLDNDTGLACSRWLMSVLLAKT